LIIGVHRRKGILQWSEQGPEQRGEEWKIGRGKARGAQRHGAGKRGHRSEGRF
jgi:hypothetical protein